MNSSDLYKIYGKEQLSTAQDSLLGIKLLQETVSAVGQADDTVLVSNDIHKLHLLLKLSQEFCKRYHVTLSPSKTKLQVFYTKDMQTIVDYAVQTNPIHINGKKIDFVTSAEHVGMLRASSGNHLTILTRFTAHNKALGGVLHTGMARGHRGNPAASLHVNSVYYIPVLLSGLAPLCLTKNEITTIGQHHKDTISNLQRLLPGTPRSVVLFLGGSLPGEALLHIRQLSIFGMITRLSENIIHAIASNILGSQTIYSRSWFHQIQVLCLQYHLLDPVHLQQSPLPKIQFNNVFKIFFINLLQTKIHVSIVPSPTMGHCWLFSSKSLHGNCPGKDDLRQI